MREQAQSGKPVKSQDLATVLYRATGPVATITMNRPERRNAQSTGLIEDLEGAFGLADADGEVRVVILAGAGEHFSSGHDLQGLLDEREADHWRHLRDTPEGKLRHEDVMYYDKCLQIRDFRKPTIAQVQGACVAAGLMLACMCDLIVASEDARFSNPVLRMSGAGVELLVEPYEMGFRKAKEFLFTGETIGAQEAWRLGLVNKVVAPGQLASATLELAEAVARVPPITAQMVKRSINDAQDLAGQRMAYRNHFMIHQYTSNTETALRMLSERKRMGSMREVFTARDRGDAPV